MNAPRRLAVLLACVLSSGWLAAQTTFVWTGNATTLYENYGVAHANAGANWVGGTAPTAEDPAVLAFGVSTGLSSTSGLSVLLPEPFAVLGLTFTGPMPDYYLSGNLRLGEGATGPTLTLAGTDNSRAQIGGSIELVGSQTWTINDGTVSIYGPLSQASPGTILTKSGSGSLTLHSSQSTFGGLTIESGTLFVGTSSSLGDSSLISGPVGSGTLTLGDGTSLRANANDDLTLHNALSLGNYVTLGNDSDGNSITLAGTLTPQNTNTTIHVGVDGALFLGEISRAENGSLVFSGGNITNANGEANAATSITFTNGASRDPKTTGSAATETGGSGSFPVAVLSGNNTYTGATHVEEAGVIFYTPGSLGQTSAVSAYNGYIGTGYSGGMEAILAKIDHPASFAGALGFDTHPAASAPTVFTDHVNLAAFAPDAGDPKAGFWGLGSVTAAILRTGTITPPSGGNYVFGGGSGKLYVETNLGAPSNSPEAGIRVRSSYGDDPLTVWLQGDNRSLTGALLSDHSIVVLDSANALPALGNSESVAGRFQMDSGAYVGYTETTGWTPAQFLARFNATSDHRDSILGFDSAHAAGSYTTYTGRTIGDSSTPIDLSGLADIFIGTSTHVHLAGTISAPRAGDSTGELSVTGINGGWLTIDAPLLTPTEGAPGVTSLNVGATSSELHRRGIVELTSGASTFSGGTTFNSGYLLLGTSSTVDNNGAITQGPLGVGTVMVNSYYDWDSPATIAATSTGITLHNNFTFAGGSVQFGVPATDDAESLAYTVRDFRDHGLTLRGTLGGSVSMLSFTGNGTFTLEGDNSGLFSYWTQIGTGGDRGTPLVVAGTDTALGSTASSIYLGNGADLQFRSLNPMIGAIGGGSAYTAYPENSSVATLPHATPITASSDASFIALSPGATLTINQNSYFTGTLYANIGGTPENFSGNATAAVNASLVKTGHGTLNLAGDNSFTGTITVQNGMLIGSSATAFGNSTNTILLEGGGVGVASGFTLSNPISFGSVGGTLGGNGTIASTITAGPNVTIAPGNSPGQLTFTSHLTFAGGGTASFDISNFAGSAGSGWDQIVVSSSGTFAITATIENPFTLQINSWSATSDSLGGLTTDFSTPAALAILQTSTPITGLLGNGQAGSSNLVLNTSNFTAHQGGEFSLSLSTDNTTLVLNFTPVPEPSTYALFGLGLLAVAGSAWRQRRRR